MVRRAHHNGGREQVAKTFSHELRHKRDRPNPYERKFDESHCTCTHFPIAHDVMEGCTLCPCTAAWVKRIIKVNRRSGSLDLDTLY